MLHIIVTDGQCTLIFEVKVGFNVDLLYVISECDYDLVFKLDTISGELFVDGELDNEHEVLIECLLNITVQDKVLFAFKMTKTCSWGNCINTDHKNPTLRFISFVKPYGTLGDHARAARWVYLCGRKNFSLENINQHSYICARHFPNYHDPKELNPHSNKNLEPYSSRKVQPKFVQTKGNTVEKKIEIQVQPKFVQTKGNTVEKKPKIPVDLHNVEQSEARFKNIKTFSKRKIANIEVPYAEIPATPPKIKASYSSLTPKQIKFLGHTPMDFVKNISNENSTAEEIVKEIEQAGRIIIHAFSFISTSVKIAKKIFF